MAFDEAASPMIATAPQRSNPSSVSARTVGDVAHHADARRHDDRRAVTSRPSMLLTARDVEAELQLGRTRTYELLRSGQIPVIRLGRAVRVSREWLEQWIAEQTSGRSDRG